MRHQTTIISLIFFLIIFSGVQSVSAATMRCERYLMAGENLLQGGVKTFNRDYPKVLTVNQTDLNKFKKVPNRPVIRYTRKVNFNNSQASGVMQYYLFPNKKLRLTHPQVSDIRAAWKCDMTPEEVLASQPLPEKPLSTQTKECRSGNLKACNQIDLCERATTTKWSSTNRKRLKVWETNQEWQNYVVEAKQRGLNCDVEEAFKRNGPSNISSGESMSLSKAKAECTSLGFNAGTEKHGDCVMKLLDN